MHEALTAADGSSALHPENDDRLKLTDGHAHSSCTCCNPLTGMLTAAASVTTHWRACSQQLYLFWAPLPLQSGCCTWLVLGALPAAAGYPMPPSRMEVACDCVRHTHSSCSYQALPSEWRLHVTDVKHAQSSCRLPNIPFKMEVAHESCAHDQLKAHSQQLQVTQCPPPECRLRVTEIRHTHSSCRLPNIPFRVEVARDWCEARSKQLQVAQHSLQNGGCTWVMCTWPIKGTLTAAAGYPVLPPECRLRV